jgi:hypothetical protein
MNKGERLRSYRFKRGEFPDTATGRADAVKRGDLVVFHIVRFSDGKLAWDSDTGLIHLDARNVEEAEARLLEAQQALGWVLDGCRENQEMAALKEGAGDE